MSRPVKIVLYAVCITMAVVFGFKAKGEFRKAAVAKQLRQQALDEASGTENTNVIVEATNVATEITNAAAVDTNDAAAVITETNTTATNVSDVAATNAKPSAKSAAQRVAPAVSYSGMITYVLLCGLGFVGLAFLLARDVSHFVAHRAE